MPHTEPPAVVPLYTPTASSKQTSSAFLRELVDRSLNSLSVSVNSAAIQNVQMSSSTSSTVQPNVLSLTTADDGTSAVRRIERIRTAKVPKATASAARHHIIDLTDASLVDDEVAAAVVAPEELREQLASHTARVGQPTQPYGVQRHSSSQLRSSITQSSIRSRVSVVMPEYTSDDDVRSTAPTQVLEQSASQHSTGSGGEEKGEESNKGALLPIEPAVRLRSTVYRRTGETVLESAERSLSNTSDDIKDLSLSRIACQWDVYHCIIAGSLIDSPISYDTMLSRQRFFALSHTEQADCAHGGIVVYGDLCAIHSRSVAGVFVHRSGELCGGLGLWTSWARVRREIICEYKGAIRLQTDGDGSETVEGEMRCKYAIDLPGDLPSGSTPPVNSHFVIDAARSTDGFARYINDRTMGEAEDGKKKRKQKRKTARKKRKNESPAPPSLTNCEFTQGLDIQMREHRVYVTATRDIKAGEELSVQYGSEYWTDLRESDNRHCAAAQIAAPRLLCM